jgi:hypothetical protein
MQQFFKYTAPWHCTSPRKKIMKTIFYLAQMPVKKHRLHNENGTSLGFLSYIFKHRFASFIKFNRSRKAQKCCLLTSRTECIQVFSSMDGKKQKGN